MSAPATRVTTADLRERLTAKPWRHTYDGIPIWETEDGEQVVTIGFMDPAVFARAVDAYLRDVRNETIPEVAGLSLEEFEAGVEYRQVRLTRLEDFPEGEFTATFDAHGGVDVTIGRVW